RAAATTRIRASPIAVNLSPNEISFQVQTRTIQRRLIPSAMRETSALRPAVLATPSTMKSIDAGIMNIRHAVLTCWLMGAISIMIFDVPAHDPWLFRDLGNSTFTIRRWCCKSARTTSLDVLPHPSARLRRRKALILLGVLTRFTQV